MLRLHVPSFVHIGVTALPDNAWYQLGPALNKLPVGQEPKYAQSLGSPEKEPFGIYISDEAADFIGKYLLGNPQLEMGGLLVGYVLQSHRPFIIISGAIEARYAHNVAGGVSFTEKSFEYMRRVWEREYPDTLVLGWFCSHADTGVQMSRYDRFVHERWFTQPWQVAFIVDTIRNASLFHCRRDNQLVPIENFAVWSAHLDPLHTITHQAVVPPLTDEPLRRESELLVPMTEINAYEVEVAAVTDRNPSASRQVPLIYWFLLLGVLFAFTWPSLPWSLPRLWSTLGERREQLRQLEEYLDADNSVGSVGDASAPAASDVPNTGLSFGDSTVESDWLHEADTSATLYEIEQGDTLWHISERTFGDPLQYRRLAEVNQITDPSLIHPGTVLKLTP